MALEAAYHYLQRAVGHGTSTEALLLTVLLLLIIRLAWVRAFATTTASAKCKQQLPPTPPGKLPIIGHLPLIGSHPHVSFRDLAAKHGRDGLMLVHVGAVPTIVVSTPQAAEAVLRTHDHVFASRPRNPVADIIRYNSTDIAFAPYGDYWRRARKVVNTHLLSVKMVYSKRHDREEEVRLVVAKIRELATAAPGKALDMTELLGGYASDFVCRAVLGESHRKNGRNELFRELTEISASLLGGFNLEDYFPRLANLDVFLRVVCSKAMGVSKRWDNLFNELIAEYEHGKEDNAEDFVHLLLSLKKEYGLSTDNVKAILVNMFEAAIETSFLVLEYSMAELINNRHVMAKVQKEVRESTPGGEKLDLIMEEGLSGMPYLKATIKEAMRIHPPAPFLLPHFSTNDCEVRLIINKIREAATRGTAVDMSELLSGYTNDVVCRAVLGESHRKEGRNRLFSELTEINVSLLGGFSLENYIPPNMDMFEAGIETSYLTLEYGMAELMNNRHILTKLQEEEDLSSMAYLRATIKETLRMHPPAPFLLPHFSTADCKIDGYLIPANTRVLVNAWALGRDPSSWERPEDFWPERFLQDQDGDVDTQMRGFVQG
ncbi:Cytochrome P450 71C1 [Triticum urartu]|uniref:Cytochrome P450 71C1 n=1 Tax=Triticum urartu TaxID=4572 RepID=M7ZYE1_TRIUA|nr:Cytochrome P450 71C1 [Triticum urartu]